MRLLIAMCMLATLVFESGNGTALNRARRVVGGQTYPRGKFRYSVSLWFQEQYNLTSNPHNDCGGSLINANWVLSAASCFHDPETSNVSSWKVAIGMYRQTDPEDSFQIREIAKIHTLPSFNIDQYYGNLVLLRLSRPVDLTDSRVTTIDYNHASCCPAVSQRCKIIGWGQTSENSSGSDYPQVAFVNIIDTAACNNSYNSTCVTELLQTTYNLGSTHMCAGLPRGGADDCYGDAGGPLLCKCVTDDNNDDEDLFDDQGYVIVGISSFGIGCGRRSFPGVYTRVSAFSNFISETIARNP